MMPLSVFSAYVYFGNDMSISQIVLVSMMLQKLRDSSRRGSHVYEMFVQLAASMKNVQKYYVSDEVQPNIVASCIDESNTTAMRVKGNFSWGFEKSEVKDEDKKEESPEKEAKKVSPRETEGKKLDSIMNLKNIDLDIKEGEFVIIVGQVGSGKSSLLNAMFGEMLYVPDEEIKMAGGLHRTMTQAEFEGIKASVLGLKVKEGQEPIKTKGQVSYVE